jgi:hypothetical protein
MRSEPDRCPACADLRARLDAVLQRLALAAPSDPAYRGGVVLSWAEWSAVMALLAPPAEGAAPPPGGVG